MEWEKIWESYRAAKEAALRRKYDQSALFLRTALSLVEHRLNGILTDDPNRDQLVKVRDYSFKGEQGRRQKVRKLAFWMIDANSGYVVSNTWCLITTKN